MIEANKENNMISGVTAKIDKNGNLMVYRKNEFKLQLCPYNPPVIANEGSNLWACGDWCPSFQEHKDTSYTNCVINCMNRFSLYKIIEDER